MCETILFYFRSQQPSLVTLVQRYVSIELEVSMAFLIRENRDKGRTDRHIEDERAATLTAVPIRAV